MKVSFIKPLPSGSTDCTVPSMLIMKYIDRTKTVDTISPESARTTGKAFGEFQAMLVDIDAELKESIPDFHNMEYRLRQLRDAVEADAAGRAGSVRVDFGRGQEAFCRRYISLGESAVYVHVKLHFDDFGVVLGA